MKMDYDEPKLNIRISEDDAKSIAAQSQKIITGERAYELSGCDYNESLGFYQVTFNYVTDGFKTSDGMLFNISELGEVIDYCACNNGVFDNVYIPEMDKDALFSKAVEILNEDGTIKENIKCNDIMIDFVDDNIVYAVHVCYNNSDSNETIATVVNINAE